MIIASPKVILLADLICADLVAISVSKLIIELNADFRVTKVDETSIASFNSKLTNNSASANALIEGAEFNSSSSLSARLWCASSGLSNAINQEVSAWLFCPNPDAPFDNQNQRRDQACCPLIPAKFFSTSHQQ